MLMPCLGMADLQHAFPIMAHCREVTVHCPLLLNQDIAELLHETSRDRPCCRRECHAPKCTACWRQPQRAAQSPCAVCLRPQCLRCRLCSPETSLRTDLHLLSRQRPHNWLGIAQVAPATGVLPKKDIDTADFNHAVSGEWIRPPSEVGHLGTACLPADGVPCEALVPEQVAIRPHSQRCGIR